MRRAAHDVVKLPIDFSFILSRVFSLKVATFCSNPFEHVYNYYAYNKMYLHLWVKLDVSTFPHIHIHMMISIVLNIHFICCDILEWWQIRTEAYSILLATSIYSYVKSNAGNKEYVKYVSTTKIFFHRYIWSKITWNDIAYIFLSLVF